MDPVINWADNKLSCFFFNLLIVLCCWGDFVLGIRGSISQGGSFNGFRVGAVRTVPAVPTFQPRQLFGHGGEQVMKRPGDDHVVVETYIQGYDNHGVAHTCRKKQDWCHIVILSDRQSSSSWVLWYSINVLYVSLTATFGEQWDVTNGDLGVGLDGDLGDLKHHCVK